MRKFLIIKRIVIIFCSIAILYISCENDDLSPKKPPLNDDRFSDTFIYYYKTIARDGINERYQKISLEFDGTTIVFFTDIWKSYSTSLGWSIGDTYYDIEFEFKDNMYRATRWGYDNFSEWLPFEFADDNNTLILRKFKMFKDSDLTLHREVPELKGQYKIQYVQVGSLYSGYSTGLGEFVSSPATSWVSTLDKIPANRWNTERDGSGTNYYGNEYIYYNGSDLTLYAVK